MKDKATTTTTSKLLFFCATKQESRKSGEKIAAKKKIYILFFFSSFRFVFFCVIVGRLNLLPVCRCVAAAVAEYTVSLAGVVVIYLLHLLATGVYLKILCASDGSIRADFLRFHAAIAPEIFSAVFFTPKINNLQVFCVLFFFRLFLVCVCVHVSNGPNGIGPMANSPVHSKRPCK